MIITNPEGLSLEDIKRIMRQMGVRPMTDTKELVARLRKEANVGWCGDLGQVFTEAADLIEQQDAEIERLRTQIKADGVLIEITREQALEEAAKVADYYKPNMPSMSIGLQIRALKEPSENKEQSG